MQEFDDFAEDHGVDPPTTVWTGTENNVKRHTDKAGTNPRTSQVLNKSVCY